MKFEHRQYPLGSGFTAASTVDDVLAGLDLSGKNVVITAGHAGLGLATTRALSKAGAFVTVATRHPDRVTGVEARKLDLLDPDSIDAFAADYLATGRSLHILINNAGVAASPGVTKDARGYEIQFATNHLGHFQLTLGLLPALRAAHGARVVTVSSGAQRMTDILWDDPHFTRTEYDGHLAYAQSKTANVLFTVELDRRFAADGIRGYAVHPGIVVGTSLNNSASREARQRMGLVDAAGNAIIDPEQGKKTLRQGASTIVFAATSPLLDGIGGVYLKDNDISELDEDPQPIDLDTDQGPPTAVVRHSIDPDSARRLWRLSEDLLADRVKVQSTTG